MAAELTGEELLQLAGALHAAYVTPNDFNALLLAFDTSLDDLTSQNDNYRTRLALSVKQMQARGALLKLVTKAREDNADNPDLRRFEEMLKERSAAISTKTNPSRVFSLPGWNRRDGARRHWIAALAGCGAVLMGFGTWWIGPRVLWWRETPPSNEYKGQSVDKSPRLVVPSPTWKELSGFELLGPVQVWASASDAGNPIATLAPREIADNTANGKVREATIDKRTWYKVQVKGDDRFFPGDKAKIAQWTSAKGCLRSTKPGRATKGITDNGTADSFGYDEKIQGTALESATVDGEPWYRYRNKNSMLSYIKAGEVKYDPACVAR
jgi:hypothetical protein